MAGYTSFAPVTAEAREVVRSSCVGARSAFSVPSLYAQNETIGTYANLSTSMIPYDAVPMGGRIVCMI